MKKKLNKKLNYFPKNFFNLYYIINLTKKN